MRFFLFAGYASKRTIWNALRLRSGHFKRNFIIICDSGKSADFPESPFHGKGRKGNQHLLSVPLKKDSLPALPQEAVLQIPFSFTTPAVKMEYRNARRRSDIPKYKIIFR